MKKNISLKLILIIALSVIIVAAGVVTTVLLVNKNKGGSYTENGEVVTGGVDVGTKDGAVVFYGADDLHVTLSVTKDTLDAGAYVYEDGLKVNVEVDTSKVTFGTAGEYEIVYRYGENTVNKKIFIYGLPSVTGANTFSTQFSKAPIEIFNGLTAVDSFGKALDLQIIDDDGMIDLDGSYNVGSYDVKIIAIDKAGQIARFTRTVTVTEERNPVILSAYSYDVNEESFSFELDSADSAEFIGLSFNGTGVPAEYLTVSSNTFTVNKQFFYNYLLKDALVSDLENGDAYVMSVLTTKGKTKTEFKLLDKESVVYDLSVVNEFALECYPCFTPIKVEKITLKNKYQNVTPVYTIVKGGERVPVQNGLVTFPSDGEWQLEIDLRGEKVYTALTAYYDLGYKNGTIYGENNPITNNLPNGYSLIEFVVTGSNGGKILHCDNAAEFTVFANAVSALNTKGAYNLTVKAAKDGGTFEQTTSFGVVKNGASILGDISDAENMLVYNNEYTSLNFTQRLVGGRRGVYNWFGKKAIASSDKSKITFSEEVRNQMKKDYYISFDIYYTKEVVMIINFGTGYSYYTWGPSTIYSSIEDHLANEPTASPHSSDSVYCGDIIKFFDAAGNQIIRTKDGYDPMRNYKNQWITVQFKIEANSIPDTAGFHIYTEASSLDKQEVYISNFKVSSLAIAEDTTVNPVIKNKDEVDFEDIWA